jgi:hypothetical protein
LKQNASVKEVLFYDMAIAALENEDLEEAQENLKKISSAEFKAVVYINLAETLLKKEKTESAKFINNAIEIIEKLSETETRSGLLFALSTILLKIEPIEAQTLFRNAVKNLNKQEIADQKHFSIPIKVSLSCQGDDKTWYGGFISLPNSNIFDALSSFAKQNPDDAKLIAENIDDKVTKIRSLALITKIALVNEKEQAKRQH